MFFVAQNEDFSVIYNFGGYENLECNGPIGLENFISMRS